MNFTSGCEVVYVSHLLMVHSGNDVSYTEVHLDECYNVIQMTLKQYLGDDIDLNLNLKEYGCLWW